MSFSLFQLSEIYWYLKLEKKRLKCSSKETKGTDIFGKHCAKHVDLSTYSHCSSSATPQPWGNSSGCTRHKGPTLALATMERRQQTALWSQEYIILTGDSLAKGCSPQPLHSDSLKLCPSSHYCTGSPRLLILWAPLPQVPRAMTYSFTVIVLTLIQMRKCPRHRTQQWQWWRRRKWARAGTRQLPSP